jgi:hypothetical protein
MLQPGFNSIEYLKLCEDSDKLTKYFENRGRMGEYFQMIYNCEDELKRLGDFINKKD